VVRGGACYHWDGATSNLDPESTMRWILLLSIGVVLTSSVALAAHPALRAFGLDDPPAGPLFLVRSTGTVLSMPGVQVHARRGDAAIVSASEPEVDALRRAGALVVPLEERERAAAGPAVSIPVSRSPLIQELVDGVAWAGLAAKIGELQAFGTRHSFSPQVNVVADTLSARFAALGLVTEFHTFQVSGHSMRNVIATQPGVVEPDSIVVICAHYDCTSENPQVFAPGADDNASGTAAVLTAAELLAGIPCRYTIKYICFAGEEQGLRGSQAWVHLASQQHLAIIAALNYDMIGWWTPGVDFDVEIEANQASVWLADLVVTAAATYTDMPFELHVYDGAWWGDHASFWDNGYAALNNEEAWDWGDADFNPRYHSTGDLLQYVDPDYTVGITRIALASLATLARPVGDVGVPGATPAAIVVRAHPNPFNGRVTVSVAGAGGGDRAILDALDLRGRRVATIDVPLVGGAGETVWSATDAAGRPLPTGTYVLRQAGAAGGPGLRVLYAK
jgi:hypothetical protein